MSLRGSEAEFTHLRLSFWLVFFVEIWGGMKANRMTHAVTTTPLPVNLFLFCPPLIALWSAVKELGKIQGACPFRSTVFEPTRAATLYPEAGCLSVCLLVPLLPASLRRNMRYSCVRSRTVQIHWCFSRLVPWVLTVRVRSVLESKCPCETQQRDRVAVLKLCNAQKRHSSMPLLA